MPDATGAREQHVAEFQTTVRGLLALRDWLAADGVTQVAMEATGVYWKPVWAILEDEFDCLLVNARHVKQVDVLRKHAGKVCVCELVPLFDVAQPTLSHHLKKLREAGIVDSERQGLWAYYYVLPDALQELSAWLK